MRLVYRPRLNYPRPDDIGLQSQSIDQPPVRIRPCSIMAGDRGAPAEDGFGMRGSGLFILNPPWTLHKTLREVMPYLVKVFGRDSGAGFVLEQREN